jgi:hypothetical protein
MESISLLSFPLEKLINLEISRYQIADFLLSMKRFHRLEILKALFSSNQYQDINVLPRLPIPTLQTLSLKGWDSIDVSVLINLTRLEVGSASTVIGKMDVYPQLRSLKGSEDAFLKDDMTKYPKLTSFVYQHMTEEALLNVKQYENISKLRLASLDYEDGPAPYIESFAVGERMQYLDINVRVNKFTNIPPGRFLPRMKLSSYGSKDLSFCANVCQLHLWNCELLESVYAVKDVPYLSIYSCNNIYDLACLGTQRY